jgi:hypothetical protein
VPEASQRYLEGLLAGLIGGGTIALWFLLLDAINGRPFSTPSLLGTAVFGRGPAPASYEGLPVRPDMVIAFTWIHFLVFALIGGAAAWLLARAEKNPNLGWGIILLFVVFEFGFVAFALLLFEPVLQALRWPMILVGNLLAAGAMGLFFRRRHPNLVILP